MEAIQTMLAAQPTEHAPGIGWLWLAALVVLTVLSYVARKMGAKGRDRGNADKAQDTPEDPAMPYRLDETAPARRPDPPRRTRPPAAQVRHVRPVPTGPPDPPPRPAGLGHGTALAATDTITEVRLGTLETEPVIEPAVVSVEVTEPLHRHETPGRLTPARRPEAVTDSTRHRIGLRRRDDAVRAIIHAEILGPPLALRDRPRCWEI